MPKIVDHDQYRKELLDKCFDLFAEKGYAAITMRQIANGLGVSTGTLYHYFPSKEAIFEQLVEEMAQRDIVQVQAELASGQTLVERLELAQAFLDRNQDYFFKQLMIFTDYYQQQSRESNQDNVNVLEHVCDRLQPFIAEMLGVADPEVTKLVFSLVDGISLSRIYGCHASSFLNQFKLMSKMLVAYLEKYDAGHPMSYIQPNS